MRVIRTFIEKCGIKIELPHPLIAVEKTLCEVSWMRKGYCLYYDAVSAYLLRRVDRIVDVTKDFIKLVE
jgi:hypothetical protein